MSETPEIPEANDPFSKQVAITIALLAVVLAFIENKGDNAKTDAIIKTSEAANRWGYYQSKSIKQNIYETELEILSHLKPIASQADAVDPEAAVRRKSLLASMEKPRRRPSDTTPKRATSRRRPSSLRRRPKPMARSTTVATMPRCRCKSQW